MISVSGVVVVFSVTSETNSLMAGVIRVSISFINSINSFLSPPNLWKIISSIKVVFSIASTIS